MLNNNQVGRQFKLLYYLQFLIEFCLCFNLISINFLTEESTNRVISICSPIIHLHLHLYLFQHIVSPRSNPSSLFVYTSYLDSTEKEKRNNYYYFASSDWSLTTRPSIDRISMRNKTVTNSRSMGLWIFPLCYIRLGGSLKRFRVNLTLNFAEQYECTQRSEHATNPFAFSLFFHVSW